jgi:glycosyltransferase involved in cell wall biosynthesis
MLPANTPQNIFPVPCAPAFAAAALDESAVPGSVSEPATPLSPCSPDAAAFLSGARVRAAQVQQLGPLVQAQRVHVLHLINGEHFSGAERVQQNLGKQLDQFGFAAEFACLKPGKFNELSGLPAERLHAVPMRGRLDLGVIRTLCKLVGERDVQLLHAHTPRTALVAACVAWRTGTPWVYHVHSPTARDSTRSAINRVNDAVERAAMASCSMIMTVSRSLRRELLRRGVARERLVSIPNGVAAIEPIVPEARRTQTEWRLGMLALMRPRKGVEVAIDAMRRLRERGVPVTLDLIGGFETQEYQRQILGRIADNQLEHQVQWRGFTNDVPAAVRGLDALVLPSLFGEGMPMVVLEALSAGVPVVATRVEGTPEVVRDGVEGLLAQAGDACDLAGRIEELVDDRERWAVMSRAAVARHRGRFSDTEMARRVARSYRRLLFTPPQILEPKEILGINGLV